MCSNFSQNFKTRKPKFEDFIDPDQITFDLEDKNIFPHQKAIVICKNSIEEMNFSLIPEWSKERKPKFATYNARIESILEKPNWKNSFLKHHCIVPISTFREPVYEGTMAGNIVEFSSDETLLAAGIYNNWVDKSTGEIVPSFAIITKSPYPFIQKVGHDRSPLFLDSKKAKEWLFNASQSTDELKKYLEKNYKPFDEFTVMKVRELKTKP